VGHRDALIVDPATPYPEEQERLFEVYDRWIGRYGPAQAIFLTHHHGDHIGGALALKERFDLAIWAHPETAARVGFSVDRHLEDGESLGPWQVLHTPGHAPGHLCLWNPKTRLLVAGDMVASLGSIVIDPSEGDMRLYLEGLRRLEGLNPRGMVPAHGAFIRNPVGRLAAYQRHRLWREEQVIDALREGTATVSTLTQRAYRDVSTSILWLAERSTLAHLYKLRDEGRASEVSGQWSRVETTT
jgi:glyoxylase-like metal-dependent hydrolase (beta-lactamase superfamily II)